MAKKLFAYNNFWSHDKRICVQGPEDFRLYVDYDDVDHDIVDIAITHMLEVLNTHWNTEEFKAKCEEVYANRKDEDD